MTKITGTVKWFSNRKGFGFIAPTSANSPTQEEIFVHQTSIFSDGEYRTLAEGSEVEFEIETESSGKLKAVNVTGLGGGPLKPPTRDTKRRPRNESKPKGDDTDEPVTSDADAGDANATKDKKATKARRRPPRNAAKPPAPVESSAPKKEREPPFHDSLNDDTKAAIAAKGIDLGQKMTIDIAIGESRVKLGQGGYAGLAHASGMVGEGTYTCSESGLVVFTWERCLEFVGGAWITGQTAKLMSTLSLASDPIAPVQAGETAGSLWGEEKSDPADAFAENGFKMKRVVLTRPPGGRGRRRIRPGKSEQ